jgi:hypothetical protein
LGTKKSFGAILAQSISNPRKVRAQSVSLNRVAGRVLHFGEGRASRFDRLSFERIPETCNWARPLRFSRFATPQFT